MRTFTLTVEFKESEQRSDDTWYEVQEYRLLSVNYIEFHCKDGHIFVYNLDSIRHFAMEPEKEEAKEKE